MKESKIESAIVKKAKELGFLTYKFISPSNKGLPDRIFISPSGKVLFMEFKSEKGKLNKLQEKVMKDMWKHKIWTYVINDIEDGIHMLKWHLCRQQIDL